MENIDKNYENWKKVRPYFAFALKLFVVVGMIIGVIATSRGGGAFMAKKAPLYFTIQSNITIGIICFVFLIYDVIGFIKKKEMEIPNWLYAVKFVCTVAITLTFLVYWCMLMPTMVSAGMASYLKTAGNLFCHTFVPIFAIVDWIIFDGKYRNKKYSFLLGTVMPLYYLAFSMICSVCNVDFGGGSNVPYFFLDYNSNGWFTVGGGKLGVFWWILIVVILVLAISVLLMWAKNAVYKKLQIKEMRLPVDEVVTKQFDERKDDDANN